MVVEGIKSSSKKNPITHFWNKLEFYSLSPRLNRLKYIALNSFWLSIIFILVLIDQKVAIMSSGVKGLIICLILPNFLALRIRRLNDSNRSGWWLLINLIPILGNIISLVLLCFWSGTKAENRYGKEQPAVDRFYYYLILSTPLVLLLSILLGFSKGENLSV